MLKYLPQTFLLLACATSSESHSARAEPPLAGATDLLQNSASSARGASDKPGESCPLCSQSLTGAATGFEVCIDDCRPENASTYSVVAPVGKQTISMITQAPRLDTLEGKTIALVGGSFMAHVTHPEIKRLILQHYPTAKVILLEEIGSAGPFPGPGVVRRAKDDFQAKGPSANKLPNLDCFVRQIAWFSIIKVGNLIADGP